MDEVILARHAESTYAERELVNGDVSIDVPLTERGRQQARALGRALADVDIGVCVTSRFGRARETAELALEGREAPRVELADLDDPKMGELEGGPLDGYRRWTTANGPDAAPPGGGESRADAVRRWARAFRTVLDLDVPIVLVVAHGLPVRYALDAAEGRAPTAAIEQVAPAFPYTLDADALARAASALESWAIAPRW